MLFPNSLGLDIQKNRVTIVYLTRSVSNKIKVAGKAVFALETEQAFEEKLKIIEELLQNFLKENRISSTAVFLGIEKNLAICRKITFPLAVKENLRMTIKYEMGKYIPIAEEDLYFDFHILSEDKKKNQINILLAACKRTDIFSCFSISETLKNSIAGVETDMTASMNAIDYLSKGNSRLVIADTPFDDIGKKIEEYMDQNDLDNTEITKDLIPAFGLALKGVFNVYTEINILPLDQRKKAGRTAYYIMFFLMGLCMLALVSWGGSHFVQQRLTLKHLDERMKMLSAEVAKIDMIQDEIEETGKKLEYVNTLRYNHVQFINIIKELSEIIPESAWISDLNYKDKKIQINGYAEYASDLVRIIEDSAIFKNARFPSPITKTKDGERFRIELEIEGF